MDIPGGFFCSQVAERCYGRTFAHRSHERIFREALLFFAFPDLLTMVCCIAGSGLMKNDADVISALTKRKRVPHFICIIRHPLSVYLKLTKEDFLISLYKDG